MGTFELHVGELPLDKTRPATEPTEDLRQLDGVKYTQMPTIRTKDPRALSRSAQRRQWIGLLSGAEYAPQPYLAQSRAYEAIGDDGSARRVLIAQRNDGLRRGGLSWRTKLYERLLRVLIGYGYKSTRAFIWLAGIILLSLILAMTWFASSHLIGLSRMAATTAPGKPAGETTAATTVPAPLLPCTFPGNVNYAISLAFPVIILTAPMIRNAVSPPTTRIRSSWCMAGLFGS
ncbi:MAG: hypothetical protein JO168_17060 [Solirubrobacterales bacterium]|nr:hypothetical protein [Solirubrobacterales bacterium]